MSETVKKLLLITKKGYPGSIALDFTALPDGPIPGFVGATWDISSGVARNNPTSNGELLTDGGLENWTAPTNLTSWLEGWAGASAINQETTVVHSGSNAVKITTDGSVSAAFIKQALLNSAGDWVQTSAWLKASANAKTVRVDLDSQTKYIIHTLTTDYAQYFGARRVSNANTELHLSRAFGSVSSDVFGDDLTANTIVPRSMFSLKQFASPYGSVGATWTRGANTNSPFGVVMCSNYNSSSFVIVYMTQDVSGFNYVVMDKCVNGVYTNLINQVVAYVAGYNIMCVRTPGTNTFQAWYGALGSEVQMGADQTIADVEIIKNRFHGLFDTSPQKNTCSGFFLA
jgi:hypothetical protein